MQWKNAILPVCLSAVLLNANTVRAADVPPVAPLIDPPGFTLWLDQQCPAAKTLRLTDLGTGIVRDFACSDVQSFVESDTIVHAVYVDLYQETMISRSNDAGSEHVGEAAEPWSPVGLVCTGLTLLGGLLFNAFKNKGCNDPRAAQPDACRITTTAGFSALGIACVFI